jgi:probable rRNA maturation factor
MEIDIFCEGKISLPYKGITKKKINEYAEKICKYLKQKNKLITIIITDNNYIRKLNKKYRKKDYATDVISFSYDNDIFPNGNIKNKHLGDLYISLEKAFTQAGEYNADFHDEVKRLLAHGILHLMGFDHELSKLEEKKMRSEEENVLKAIGK